MSLLPVIGKWSNVNYHCRATITSKWLF